MKPLTRRFALIGSICASVVGLGWLSWKKDNPYTDTLANLFGSDIADFPATRQFAEDFLARFGQGSHPAYLARFFLQSTNFLEARTNGDPLAYDGLYDPYEAPCANRLSAGWEP